MGEVIRVDFSNSDRPAEMKLGELPERELLKTAIQRELHLIEAKQQVVAGEITFEEFAIALEETTDISDYLTEQQQGAVTTFAQDVYESRLTS